MCVQLYDRAMKNQLKASAFHTQPTTVVSPLPRSHGASPILENAGATLRFGRGSRGPARLSLRVLQTWEHIELRGDNPLDAAVAGTFYRAYLVANFALMDGMQTAAEHYCIPLANVYGAMVFYCDYIKTINEAIRRARELSSQLGARSAQATLEEMRRRRNAPRSPNYAHKRLSIDLSLETMRHWPFCPRTKCRPVNAVETCSSRLSTCQ